MDIALRQNSLIIVISVGISIFISTYIAFVYKMIQNKSLRFSVQAFNAKLDKSRKVRNAKRYVQNKIKIITTLSKKEKISILIVALLMAGTSKGLNVLPLNTGVGLILGLIVIKLFEKIKKDLGRTKKLREVAILFEGIEMYSKAGYSLVQALRASKLLTNIITPSIDKCLNYWSMGPQKALEILKNELNLEESDALILLMMHLETAGVKNLQGMLQREAHNIERLQKMKAEIKIAHRPLILMIYKVLPIASILGIVIGTLLFRVYYILTNMGILNMQIF